MSQHQQLHTKCAIPIARKTGTFFVDVPHLLKTVRNWVSRVHNKYSVYRCIIFVDCNSLNVYSAGKAISVSEDAIRVVSRVEYDSNTDSLAGFVMPVDKIFILILNAFCATSFEQTEEIFMKELKASYGYLYIAQVLSSCVPPFCLALIRSDNHFTNKTVVGR